MFITFNHVGGNQLLFLKTVVSQTLNNLLGCVTRNDDLMYSKLQQL